MCSSSLTFRLRFSSRAVIFFMIDSKGLAVRPWLLLNLVYYVLLYFENLGEMDQVLSRFVYTFYHKPVQRHPHLKLLTLHTDVFWRQVADQISAEAALQVAGQLQTRS